VPDETISSNDALGRTLVGTPVAPGNGWTWIIGRRRTGVRDPGVERGEEALAAGLASETVEVDLVRICVGVRVRVALRRPVDDTLRLAGDARVREVDVLAAIRVGDEDSPVGVEADVVEVKEVAAGV